MGTCKPCCSQLSAGPCLPDCSTVAWHSLVLVKSARCQRMSQLASQLSVAACALLKACNAQPQPKAPPSTHYKIVTAWWLQASQQLVALAARLCLEPHMCFSDCKINGRPAAWASSAEQNYAATMRSNVPSAQPCRNIVSFHFVQPATAIASASAEQ